MGYFTDLRAKGNVKTEMPVYARSMPKYRKEHPDRDYSVNRAERRKRNKKRAKRGNEE